MNTNTFLVLIAALVTVSSPASAGLSSKKAQYLGGTPEIKAGTEGKTSTSDGKVFTFDYKGGKLMIPYDQIDSLEYGQKAGRRIGVAIIINPLFIFSKK